MHAPLGWQDPGACSPGVMRPFFSASSIMLRPMRSLTARGAPEGHAMGDWAHHPAAQLAPRQGLRSRDLPAAMRERRQLPAMPGLVWSHFPGFFERKASKRESRSSPEEQGSQLSSLAAIRATQPSLAGMRFR